MNQDLQNRIERVLVTGASGFLGSHICEAAHRAGYQVHALIREKSSRRWLKHPWLQIHVADLDDRVAIRNILEDTDAVIHAAGATSGYSREEFIKVNVKATRLLARESIKAGVKRLVYVSSQSAGGPAKGPRPKKEEDPDNPVSFYGESKKRAEKILTDMKDEIQVVMLRYPAVYGPRDTQMLRVFRLLEGRIQPLLGMKPVYLSLVYVTDAARAAIRALQADVSSGSVYYICDGINYSTRHFYDHITQALESNGSRIKLPFWLISIAAWWVHEIRKERSAFTRDKVAEFKQRYWLVSPEKAIKELGWNPRVLPEEGFAKTVRWYRYKRWL